MGVAFCIRCRARMFRDEDSDLSCVTCGNRMYVGRTTISLGRRSTWNIRVM